MTKSKGWYASRVKACREHLNLTQKEFGELTGPPAGAQARVHDWEVGRCEPGGLYRVKVDEILDDNGFGADDPNTVEEPVVDVIAQYKKEIAQLKNVPVEAVSIHIAL